MSFKTVSAILRGAWLIDPGFARAHMPVVIKMLKGEAGSADVGLSLYKDRMEKVSTNSIYIPRKVQVSNVSSTATVYSFYPYSSTERVPYGTIAMVDILGPVLKYGDVCSYGSVDYNDLLIRLSNSERISGIILNIDSPGGQVDGTAQLAQTIRNISRTSKPVIAIIQDGIAASAAYWIASSAQEIYVTQGTDQVGSIGAYVTAYDFSGYLEMNGVKEHIILAPQSTDKNKSYSDAMKGDYTLIQEDLKFIVQDFTKSVTTGRAGRLNTSTENPFTGKMYRAKEAIKIGLIDGVKQLPDVVTRVEQLVKLRA